MAGNSLRQTRKRSVEKNTANGNQRRLGDLELAISKTTAAAVKNAARGEKKQVRGRRSWQWYPKWRIESERMMAMDEMSSRNSRWESVPVPPPFPRAWTTAPKVEKVTAISNSSLQLSYVFISAASLHTGRRIPSSVAAKSSLWLPFSTLGAIIQARGNCSGTGTDPHLFLLLDISSIAIVLSLASSVLHLGLHCQLRLPLAGLFLLLAAFFITAAVVNLLDRGHHVIRLVYVDPFSVAEFLNWTR